MKSVSGRAPTLTKGVKDMNVVIIRVKGGIHHLM